MKHERGNMDLWAVLGIVVAIGLLGWGLKVWIADYNEGLREEGRVEIRLAVAKERNEKLLAAQTEIKRLQDEKAELEAAHAAFVADVDAEHQEAIRNAKLQRDRDVAAVHAGYRLRDPGGRGNQGCTGGSDGGASTAVAGTGVSDAKTGTDLSAEASEFLLLLTGEADEVVGQLTACQKIVADDRKGASP